MEKKLVLLMPLVLALILFCSRGFGFDIYPEYQGLSASDLTRFERPVDIDAESQSALLSYQPGLAWEEWFAAQARALDTTVGSLTNQHFLIYTRAKFETQLTEKLSFHFIYFAQRDREMDQTRQFFELQYLVHPNIQLAIYMDPAHAKRENDLGAALIVKTLERETRFFYTMHDFTRNEHNDQADFFTKSPTSYGLIENFERADFKSRIGGRVDTETVWQRPQESRIFTYKKELVFADARWRQDERRALNARLQWDQTSKTSDPGEQWKLSRWQILILEDLGSEDEALSMELGGMYASRAWTTRGDQKVHHQNIMPHALFKFRTLRREEAFDHLRVGLTATDFHSQGPDSLIPAAQSRDTLQGRLDVRYEWSFIRQAKLAAAFTFDLDEYTPLPTFEGGNLWFRTGF